MGCTVSSEDVSQRHANTVTATQTHSYTKTHTVVHTETDSQGHTTTYTTTHTVTHGDANGDDGLDSPHASTPDLHTDDDASLHRAMDTPTPPDDALNSQHEPSPAPKPKPAPSEQDLAKDNQVHEIAALYFEL